LASGVPVLVCDVNSVLDEQPHRESWERGVEKIRATCAPYFDERCGLKITRLGDFDAGLDQVLANERRFAPRSYMEESFSLAHRARQFISMYGGDTPQAPAAGCLGTAGRFKVPLEAYPYLGRRKFMSMFHRLNVKLRRLKPFIKDPPMPAHGNDPDPNCKACT
jgi:hypothetical protein